jgi:hypothetical protein
MKCLKRTSISRLPVLNVGRAEGLNLPENYAADRLNFCDNLPASMTSSMHADLERGNRLELPWLSSPTREEPPGQHAAQSRGLGHACAIRSRDRTKYLSGTCTPSELQRRVKTSTCVTSAPIMARVIQTAAQEAGPRSNTDFIVPGAGCA